MNLVVVKANAHGKRFDEVFTVVAIVECSGPEKERNGNIDGRLLRAIPGNAQPGMVEGK